MSAENWEKIKEVFLGAIELTAAERARFLRDKCGDDEQLRRAVEDLIRQDEEAGSLMSRPAIEKNAADFFAEAKAASANDDDDDPLLGKIIGAYRLTGELGRGGMGAVYLAERVDGEFRRQAAVKLIKRGMDTDFILRRFRQERQVLAALAHPNVASLLDGGTTDDHLPYFVMEYVDGKPLYQYGDDKKLSIDERLALFLQICSAVEYAHRRQIVHRDLKPSNILVKADGTVKLLDFGIAKVLDAEIGVSTIDPTQTAMRLMTPEYASPEQVSGFPVTFASDIYSLGVVLYELLTGHRPYCFKSRAPHEIARVICEEEPLRPSTGITREDNLLPVGASPSATSLSDILLSRRAKDVESLQKELSGEIEKVILKCLRKNPGERYQTAAALAGDIERCLSGEAVEAETLIQTTEPQQAEPSAPHSTGKRAFFRNGGYKLGLAAILAILILGAAFSVFVFVSEKNGSQIEARSEQAAPRSLAILPFKNETSNPENDFLCDGLSDNLINRLSYLPEIQVMARSAVLKYKGAQISPEQAGKEMNVGAVLSGRLSGSGDRVEIFLELIDVSDGSRIRSFQYAGKESELVFIQNKMASDVAAQFKIGRAGGEQKQIVSRGYTENPQAFELYLKGEFERQKATAEGNRKSIEFYRQALELDANYALAYQGLALSYRMAPAYRTLEPHEGYPLAKEAAMKALAIEPTLGSVYIPLASIKFVYDWDFAGAEGEYRQAIQLAPNNPETHSSYANFLIAMGRTDEALNELRIAQQFDPNSKGISSNIAWALYIAGRFDEAGAQLKQTLGRDPNYARAYTNLAEIYTEEGRFDEANEALQKARRISPADVLAETLTAHLYAISGRRAEALKIAASLEAKAQKKEFPAFLLAEAYAGLSDKDKAFYWLERAFQERSNWMVFTKVSRRLKPLHGDPRFDDLLKRIGFENHSR
ncbi:MAG: protein kinase [Acidobacteriota bacterium]|nr:protein kinase [Acidobacteriota bacterium]